MKRAIVSGYKCKDYGMPVKRYCQTLDLKDAPELIAKYKEAHGAHVLLIRKDILLTTTNDPNQWGMAMCLTRGASLFFST